LRHLDGAVARDIAAGPEKQLNRPTPRGARRRTGRPAWLTGTQYRGALPVQLEDPGVRAGSSAAVEPVEQLRGRVDLVVVPAIGEDGQLVKILRQHDAVFVRWTKPFSIIAVCAVHAHDLVRLRLVAGDGVEAVADQLLDQLSIRGLDTGAEQRVLVANSPRRNRILGTFAPTSPQTARAAGSEQPSEAGFSTSPFAHIDRSVARVELGGAVRPLASEVELANSDIGVVPKR
jgi:hypothetical protein